MIATADSGKQNPQVDESGLVGREMRDSDSEDDDPHMSTSNGLYKPSIGPFNFILDDIRKMEVNIGTIEDALVKKDGFNPKRAHEQLNALQSNTLLASLIGRTGSCCLLTDSHDISVRRHQLRILSEEFPDIDLAG